MKFLIIYLECLAASAVLVFVLSDPWWQSPVGYFLLFWALSLILLGAWMYGVAFGLDRLNEEKANAYRLGEQSGRKMKW